MKISRHWLNQFVDLHAISDQEFSQLFNIRTAEIDGMESGAEQFANMVIGEIKTISAHPNADKLRVTQTNIGGKVVQIVCGAPNIREGMKVIVALPGSKVRWHGEGELIELKEAELRGVKSFGMICGGDEVGLPNKVDGVADLSDLSYAAGTPLAEALGRDDTVIEVDNKSLTNRPDLWGHYGIARECAVIWNTKLEPLPVFKGKFAKAAVAVDVTDPKLCPRYMACRFQIDEILDNELMAGYLARIGHKSHGLLVDLTNYILHELGQPLHVFDAARVEGAITIRPARTGEKLVTLDGVERPLTEGMLLITDARKILAIAGVMGGASSAVSATTKEVILEAANFNPVSIRTTAQKLALRTDAVQHYEKSLDPYLPEIAVRRFFLLLEKCAKITILSAATDHFPHPPKPLKFSVDTKRIMARIGAPVTKTFISKTLKQLGFGVAAGKSADSLLLTVPTFRATKDISSEADIIEEIARFYGYEKIEPQLPRVALTLPPKQPWLQLERKIKNFLAYACHLTEIYTYSFYGPKELQRFEFEHDHVVLQNSLSAEHTHLRTSLLPGMLETFNRNSIASSTMALFEMGRVYLPSAAKDELPHEGTHVAMLFAHELLDEKRTSHFQQLKTYCAALLKHLHVSAAIKNYQPQATEHVMQKGRTAVIVAGEQVLGHIYELSVRIRSKYKIQSRIAYAEIDFELLLSLANSEPQHFKPIPKFPSKVFDVSVVVDEATEAGTMIESIEQLHPLIEKVELFDDFSSESLGEGKRALAFKVTLQATDRTLTDQDMHAVQKLIFDYLAKEYQGVIRGL